MGGYAARGALSNPFRSWQFEQGLKEKVPLCSDRSNGKPVFPSWMKFIA